MIKTMIVESYVKTLESLSTASIKYIILDAHTKADKLDDPNVDYYIAEAKLAHAELQRRNHRLST